MKKYLLLLLSLLLLTGCHTGDVPEPGTETLPETGAVQVQETESELPPESEPEKAENEPSETEPEPKKTEPFARLLSGEENFTLSTVTIPGNFRLCHAYDDTHMLYITYTPVIDETGYAYGFADKHLYMLDLTTGTIAAEEIFPGESRWSDARRQNGQFVLCDIGVDDTTGKSYIKDPVTVFYDPENGITWRTDSAAGETAAESMIYPFVSTYISSPDGRYHIQQTVDDMAGHGGLDLLYPDLTTVRLFTDIMLDDTMPSGKKAGIGDVRVYNPIGFLDDTRFVYRIGGWEWTVGYGIWDLMTGQYTEHTGYGIMGVHDGHLYLTENTSHDQYRFTHIYKATPEGEKTLIASYKKEDGVFWMENTEEYYTCPGYMEPYWITSATADGLSPENPETWSAPGGSERITIWSPDLDRELAVLAKTRGGEWYVCGDRITCVTPPGTAMPDEPEEEEPAETEPLPDTVQTEPENHYIKLLSGEEPFTVSMAELPEGEWADRWYYDDTHILWLTYDRIAGEHNVTLEYKNCMLSMLDLETGEITAALPLEDGAVRRDVTWDGSDLILYNLVLDESDMTYTAENALRITYTDGQLTAEPAEISPFPMVTNRITSPDGRYAVQHTTEEGWGRGGMDLVNPDGSTARLFTAIMLGDTLPDGTTADIQHVRGYTPLAFLDDDRFVYVIGGWEHCWGYGIYDLAAGTFQEFTEDVEYVYCVHDGHIYLTSQKRHDAGVYNQVWKVTPEGERTLLASTAEDISDFPLDRLMDPLFCADPYWIYTTDDSLFSISMYGKGKPKIYQVWSPDMDRILAEFELDGWTMNRVFFCGTQITYVP